MTIWKDAVAIVGIGESEIVKASSKSCLALHIEAALSAFDDAGITKDDVDCVITTSSMTFDNLRHANSVAANLGISSGKAQWINTANRGGASSGEAVGQAIAAIVSGLATTVLIVAGDNLVGWAGSSGGAIQMMSPRVDAEFENPYGLTFQAEFALVTQRYMHEYGATPEQFAAVSVAARKWACLNPKALMYGRPITAADVLSSPVIASPLRRLDCCVLADGAVALILVAAERAKDFRKRPVYVSGIANTIGIGEGQVHGAFSEVPSLFVPRYGSRISSRKALAMAGVALNDIDVVYMYDNFPIMDILFLEGLGYCKDGEGAAFVEGGRIEPGGNPALNTYGGFMSFGQIGDGCGAMMFVEAVRQLRGEAGQRQVDGAELALVQGYGSPLLRWPTTILRG